ncbi:MAG: SusC/RagA family TonB-linked outer membrane protein [Bacteroidaceae bacterium]|nr:SusC/RagA family TonB-linked outer membrane protein [Bacteroidaceae bacterium]
MIKIKHLFLLVLLCLVGSSVYAQKSARISGTITSDAEGPLIMVNVTERDPSNRIIEACVTDFEGNFSMVVKNTSNVLEISYVGYKTQRVEIGSRTVFNIKMVEDNMLETVDIVAEQRSRSGGLDILDREMTHATQKISMDEMDGLSFASVDEALQGQIAGLDVVFNSGDVGSGTQMRLRGNSMLEGDATPLIVVDDNIFEVDEGKVEDAIQNVSNESFAELLMINTEDIAEIEVLKDAASCAVWGSRGANGVIKIKTKRGKRGPTRVNFTYKFKDKWTPKGYNLLNGDDYTMLIKQALFNIEQKFVDIEELNYDKTFSEYEHYNNNTDWVDAVSKHGFRNEYNLNISGGGEKATFRISGGYSNETGQVIGQNNDNFSTRLALDYYVSARIKVIADFAFSYVKLRRNTNNVLNEAVLMMPNLSIYAQDSLGKTLDNYYTILKYANGNWLQNEMSGKQNPLGVADLAQYYNENYSINPQITFEYNLLGLEDNETQLKYRGMVNLNASTSTTSVYTPSSLSTNYWHTNDKNNSQADDSKSLGFTTRHQFIFTPYLGSSDHYMTMNAQFELSTGSGNSQNSTAVGLPAGSISSSTIGAKLDRAGTGKWESRNISFVYDAHYSYKSKYSLRLAVRGEGNTAMGDDRKWAAFPSISARWNVIDEPWMEWAKPYLSMLSLRPGFGKDGHAPSSNATFNSYSSYNYSYLGYAGFIMDRIRLTDLRRSDKREWNFGSDFGFFNGLVTGSFNYYHGTTYDNIIHGYKLPSSTGYPHLEYKNSGTVRNYGWELNMNLNNVKLAKDFSMSMYFNIGNNYNEILELEEAYLEQRNGKYESAENGKYLTRVQIGNPSGAIYGFRYKGVYRYSYKNWKKALKEEEAGRDGSCPIVRDADGNVVFNADGTPKQLVLFYKNDENGKGSSQYTFTGGDAIYEDVNHDGTINQLDIVYLGNSNPAAQGGFGLTFRYKKWSLRTSFTYRWDVDVVNNARMNYENMATYNNQSVAVNWRWRKEGDITEIPRAVNGSKNAYNYLGSDRFVEDASYVRLSYLQLSYSFEPAWLKKVGLKNLSLYASADNVYCWTKYIGLDPEVSNNGEGIAYDNLPTPRPRSYTLTLSLGF